MSNKLTKPHDHFFRSSMSDIRVSKGFLNQNLPEKIKKLVDMNSIEQQKESYIDDELREHVTDLLYSAKFEGKDCYIYCIVEHQSKTDPIMPFRLLEYTVSVISDHIKKTSDRKLPIVYSMVLYNGKTPYNESMDLFDLFYEQKELAKDVMFGPYQLIDLTQIEDNEFKNCIWSDIMIKNMKHIWDSDIILLLKDILKDLQIIEEQGEIGYISRLFEYIMSAGTIKDKEEFKKVIKLGFSKKTGEEVMTIAEMFRQDGFAEGEARAVRSIALQLLKDGVDKMKTAKITGLSETEIDELSREDD